MPTLLSKVTDTPVNQHGVSWSFERNLYSGLGGESYPVSLTDQIEMRIATQQIPQSFRTQFDKVVNLVQQLFGKSSQTYLNTGEHYTTITVMKDSYHPVVIYFRVGMETNGNVLTHTFSNPFFPSHHRSYEWRSSDNFFYEDIILSLENYLSFVENHGDDNYEREFFAAAYELAHQSSLHKTDDEIVKYLDALTPLAVASHLKFRTLTSDVPVELLEALRNAPEEWIKTVLPKEMAS